MPWAEPVPCSRNMKRAWRCTRNEHSGLCALVPRWWNIVARVRGF